jgi:hypothetical protein
MNHDDRPLSIACQKGSKSLAAVLLEFGAKIRGVKDEYKVTPVHWYLYLN